MMTTPCGAFFYYRKNGKGGGFVVQTIPQTARRHRLLPLCRPHRAARPAAGVTHDGCGWAVRRRWALAAALLLRQTVFHGGQPEPPAPVATSSVAATTETGRVTVAPLAATRDALARADEEGVPTTPETAPTPAPGQSDQVLPQYRALYEQNAI